MKAFGKATPSSACGQERPYGRSSSSTGGSPSDGTPITPDPPSAVEARADGLQLTRWGKMSSYAWSRVSHFTVNNWDKPTAAYVLVSPDSEDPSLRSNACKTFAIKLPRFKRVPPMLLVELLSRKQRDFERR